LLSFEAEHCPDLARNALAALPHLTQRWPPRDPKPWAKDVIANTWSEKVVFCDEHHISGDRV
jgi:hypothetical protein